MPSGRESALRGIFIVGVFLFKDAASVLQIVSVMLIIIGVVGLKIFH